MEWEFAMGGVGWSWSNTDQQKTKTQSASVVIRCRGKTDDERLLKGKGGKKEEK